MVGNMRMPRWGALFLLSFLCSSTMMCFFLVFPQVDQWVIDHQLRKIASNPLHDSLVLISAPRQSPLFCDNYSANPHVLAEMLRRVAQAGAKVVAPALTVKFPVPSECGGLPALVRLADVTQQAGSIVYPTRNPPIVRDAAKGYGTLELQPDEDGVFRGFLMGSLKASSSPAPFFQVVISSFPGVKNPERPKAMFHPRKFLRPISTSFSRTHSFAEVWASINRQEWKQLARWFEGKVVVLVPEGQGAVSIRTPWSSLHAQEQLHAWLINTELVNGWAWQPHWFFVFIGSVFTGGILSRGLLAQESLHRGAILVLGGLMVLSLGMFIAFREGWVFPLPSIGSSLGLTLASVWVWRVWDGRESIGNRIQETEQELSRLHQELVEKKWQVQGLEGQLNQARQHVRDSDSVIEQLHQSQHSIASRLRQSQEDMDGTQHQIAKLEHELDTLRLQLPVSMTPLQKVQQSEEVSDPFGECESFHILTRDSHLLQVFHDLKKTAWTSHPLLLMGETGTGKEVFAQAAHQLSPRREKPFISVNMAAIHSGLFEGELFGAVKGAFTGAVGRRGYLEAADGGTLFLDEVGELSLQLQAKLLRVLENGSFFRLGDHQLTQVNVRIIAATNRDLQSEVKAGRYREDLFYRLQSIVINLPPLRRRNTEDRMLLAQHFLHQFSDSSLSGPRSFSQGAVNAIHQYSWPGNIRELRQAIARAVVLADGPIITEADLQLIKQEGPSQEKSGGQEKDSPGRLEDAMVLDCLRQHQFDMQATAKVLGWDRSTVTQRLKGLGFQALVESQGDVEVAARRLAGDSVSVRVVERRLREYAKNLGSQSYTSFEEAIRDCRKRFRNLPERYFPAVEQLLRRDFSLPS